MPAVGGDTLFADMYAAYDGLDDETRAEIDGRTAIHDFEPFRRRLRKNGASAPAKVAMALLMPRMAPRCGSGVNSLTMAWPIPRAGLPLNKDGRR